MNACPVAIAAMPYASVGFVAPERPAERAVEDAAARRWAEMKRNAA